MNKYQQAFDKIEDYCYDYSINDSYKKIENERKLIQELIYKQNKYRWHDLRKDPLDVPNVGEKVLCVTDNKGGREVQMYREARIYENGDGEICWLWTWEHNTQKSPIAWKYIEEFKDE